MLIKYASSLFHAWKTKGFFSTWMQTGWRYKHYWEVGGVGVGGGGMVEGWLIVREWPH